VSIYHEVLPIVRRAMNLGVRIDNAVQRFPHRPTLGAKLPIVRSSWWLGPTGAPNAPGARRSLAMRE